jgi:hypothetical protein
MSVRMAILLAVRARVVSYALRAYEVFIERVVV